MRVYSYYMKPGETALADAVAVPEGFSWWALVFGLAWTLYHRLWLASLTVAFVMASFAWMGRGPHGLPDAGVVLMGVFAVFVACVANDWRRESLLRRGYLLAGIAAAHTRLEADRRFFEQATARIAPLPNHGPVAQVS